METARAKIPNALIEKFKEIKIVNGFEFNLPDSYIINTFKFWDDVTTFPFVMVIPGVEKRERLPSNFTWIFLEVIIKVYVKNSDSVQELEKVLGAITNVIENNTELNYGAGETCDIEITETATDEGLLNPLGVGEIRLTVRYERLT